VPHNMSASQKAGSGVDPIAWLVIANRRHSR
jgi:hypothetical protein